MTISARKSLSWSAATWLVAAPVTALPPPAQVGDVVSFSIPFGNDARNSSDLLGAHPVVLSAPSWLSQLNTSVLVPLDLPPGESMTYRLDFQVLSAPPQGAAEVVLEVLSTGPALNAPRFVWHFRSSNAFRTFSAEALDEAGDSFGGAVSPDTLPPVTTLSFVGASYVGPTGTVFLSTGSAVGLAAFDQVVDDAVTSDVSFTGYALDRAVTGVAQLTAFTSTFTLPAGPHSLTFASVDGAGNAEALNVSSITVDGSPPGPPLSLASGGSSPSPWQSGTAYSLTWQNPQDVSGIGQAYVKVGAAPAVATGPATSFIVDIGSAAPQGAVPASVWLADNVQNVDPGNAAVVMLRHDSVAPRASAVAASTFAVVSPIPIAFSSQDPGAAGLVPTASGVQSTTLWYRKAAVQGCASAPGPWTQGPSSPGGGEGVDLSTGVFAFVPDASDVRYCFYARAQDAAGNQSPAPADASVPMAEVVFDTTPPVLSGLRVADLTTKRAVLAFLADEPASAKVDWGLTAALGNSLLLPAATSFTATLDNLPSPAVVYYRISMTNAVGLTSVSSTQTLSTPLDLSVPTSIDNVLYPGQPIVIRLDNPGVTQANYTIDGQAGPVPTSGGFTVLPPAVSGPATLTVTIDGVQYSRQFLVDAAPRTARLARDVVGPGTGPSASAQSQVLAAAGQPASTDGTGMVSDHSRLFLGYFANLDPVPPDPIGDLAAAAGPGRGQVTLRWTAVGDDKNVGTAMVYDLRKSSSPIVTEDDFKNAAVVPLSVYPAKAGTVQTAVLSGLPDGSRLSFSLKAIDEAMNRSAVGPAASATTLSYAASAELVGGAPAFELLSTVAGATVAKVGAAAAGALALAAGQGLVPAGPIFEVTSPVNPLPAPGALTLRYDPAFVGAAAPQLKAYQFDGSAWTLLADVQLVADRNLVTAAVSHFSYIGLLAPDAEAPTTELLTLTGRRFVSPQGRLFISTATQEALSARDPPVGNLPGTERFGAGLRGNVAGATLKGTA